MAPAIRRATPDDGEAVLALVRSMHHEGNLGTDERSEQALNAVLAESTLGFVLVSTAGGNQLAGYLVVGCGYSIEFLGRDAFVDELYVVPAERGHGLGTALLQAAEAECMRRGIAALHLEVDIDNPRALALYRRMGYEDHPRHLMTKWVGRRGPRA